MTEPRGMSLAEAAAVLRHLRWGYVRHAVAWLVVCAGLTMLEPKAEALWEPLIWVCRIGAWGALLGGCLHLSTALFRSDKWLLKDFVEQTGFGRDEGPTVEKETVPTWEDADVERFVARLKKDGVHLVMKSSEDDPERAVQVIAPDGLTDEERHQLRDHIHEIDRWLRGADARREH